MTRAFGRIACWACGKVTSTNGLARTSHLRKHVREGLLIETLVGYYPEIGELGYYDFKLAPGQKIKGQI